jgi:ribosomal-protein-alanine N-acetyltransferase
MKSRKGPERFMEMIGQDSILIRRLKPSDIAGALEIDRMVFGGYDPAIFTAFYEYHPRTTFVAESMGTIVGFILGFKHTPLEGRIFWLAVRPGYQNKGVATRLLTAILRTFRLMGAMSATLEVRVSNKKAQNLYSTMGFEMTGVFPGYYSDGEAAIIMKRRL